ncbi:MAG: AP4A hydrolase [Microgenomates group bacterium GW2011_GWA1_48_10]|nr:MAG: AP4A hydrolase [Microgenomates group bacterium GW2011_GWA1_48_10]
MKQALSAGGVAYKQDPTGIVWLLIKPRPSIDFPKERYQLPKGLIEEGEGVAEAALREVKEETGIMATIKQKVSESKYIYTYEGERVFKIVSYFLMEYVSGQPTENSEVEKVMWLSYPEAYERLTYSSDKQILKKAQGDSNQLLTTNGPGR